MIDKTEKWWMNDDNFVKHLSNEEYGVSDLMGRKLEDGWEYAAVFWRFGSPTLVWIIKNGEVILDNE